MYCIAKGNLMPRWRHLHGSSRISLLHLFETNGLSILVMMQIKMVLFQRKSLFWVIVIVIILNWSQFLPTLTSILKMISLQTNTMLADHQLNRCVMEQRDLLWWKKYCKIHTVKNILTTQCLIKIHLQKAFTNLSSKLCMKTSKKNSLIDFLVHPTILTCAMTHENIIHGIVSNGFLDDKFHWFPLMNKILWTCRMPSKEQYDACLSAFPILFEHFYKDGHVSDKLFEEHGIPKDIDIFGSVRVCNAGMTQENQQQAKTLIKLKSIRGRRKWWRLSTIEGRKRDKQKNNMRRRLQLIKQLASYVNKLEWMDC